MKLELELQLQSEYVHKGRRFNGRARAEGEEHQRSISQVSFMSFELELHTVEYVRVIIKKKKEERRDEGRGHEGMCWRDLLTKVWE